MLTKNRIFLHTGFWLVYFAVTCFNELYLTSDYAGSITGPQILQVILSVLNLMLIKLTLVYYAMYSYLPRLLKTGIHITRIVEGILVLLASVIVYRAIIQYINWPILLKQSPPEISIESRIARYLYSLLEITQILAITITIKLLRIKILQQTREKELIQQKMKAELAQLKAQINPHFLFNMLNSIYSLSRTQSEKTPDVVLKLSSLLRFMLYESEKNQITVKQEIQLIEEFIELQQLRFTDRVKVHFEHRDDNPHYMITPLLLFPFFENAYKHGTGSRGDHSFIDATLNLHKGKLLLSIENSINKTTVEQEEYKGIGLTNIRKQLTLLYKEFDLKTQEDTSVFRIELNIDLNSYIGHELYNHR